MEAIINMGAAVFDPSVNCAPSPVATIPTNAPTHAKIRSLAVVPGTIGRNNFMVSSRVMPGISHSRPRSATAVSVLASGAGGQTCRLMAC